MPDLLNPKFGPVFSLVTPTEVGVQGSVARAVDTWIPAFPADQVRGLKAYGMTMRDDRSTCGPTAITIKGRP